MTFPYHEIVEQLTVRHIVTPWDRIVGFPPAGGAADALSAMRAGSFDYAPVIEGDRVLGRVFHSDLEKDRTLTVGAFLEPLSESYLLSAHSPIPRVMRWLTEDRWLLVVEGRGFAGLVTPSDLNRQAARAYFYLLVGELEVRLAEVIREVYRNQEDALSHLRSSARSSVLNNHRRASEGNIDSDYVAAMTLRDLITIAAATPRVQEHLPQGSNLDWAWVYKEIGDFRNSVMHLARPLLTDTEGLSELIQIEACLRQLAGSEVRGSDGMSAQ